MPKQTPRMIAPDVGACVDYGKDSWTSVRHAGSRYH